MDRTSSALVVQQFPLIIGMSHLFSLANQRDNVSTPTADLAHENMHLSSSLDL